ncbi:hypothetical protein [Halalkalibacter hemicellulosilyticus]|uniref:Uncharacterized protein n=1 Tax=Halalkalibacter hemicellulosilyticusJCM 9152 TaxID=1236971 RepID=W4QH58_9BACI|nr:hypothetical protein [Halalkalibacter hemicellulosilyticus]GAE30689.1 hypothetical protein JCM9152_2105 [Halalkalibacter hemicellulosilyticusJCM 9152]
MRKERKEIVIREIKHWRKSKLLPEHYCDFLLTLYMEGEGAEETSFFKKFTLIPLIMVYAMFLLTVLIFYFTQFPLLLQIGIAIIFAVAIFMIAKQVEQHSLLLARLYQLMAAMIVYLLTMQIGFAIMGNHTLVLGFATLINGLLWTLIGWKWKTKLFFLSGVMAFILAIVIFIR